MIQLLEIKEIKYNYKKTTVHDIEVESAHQYIANNIVVHNCTTGVKTGIHASMHYLLTGIKKVQEEIKLVPQNKPFPKVIADGGISTIDRAIKCLALGADYVMMGKMFAQCEEACGYIRKKWPNNSNERLYYGMASKRGQKDISGDNIKTEEGIELWIDVRYKLVELIKEFKASLKSAMSYTNCKNLNDFKKVKCEIMSFSERNAYYK